jgi:hypothetical protein
MWMDSPRYKIVQQNTTEYSVTSLIHNNISYTSVWDEFIFYSSSTIAI